MMMKLALISFVLIFLALGSNVATADEQEPLQTEATATVGAAEEPHVMIPPGTEITEETITLIKKEVSCNISSQLHKENVHKTVGCRLLGGGVNFTQSK